MNLSASLERAHEFIQERNMKQYVKKPVVIEAFQITDSTFENPIDGLTYDYPCIRIDTLEGVMVGNIGDWIIRGVKGELYPCKPDIFELTYEEKS